MRPLSLNWGSMELTKRSCEKGNCPHPIHAYYLSRNTAHSLSSQKHDANTAAYYLMLSKHAATSEENPSQATASSSITSDNENSQALEESPRSEVPQLFPGVLIKHLDKTQKEDPTALARGVMEDKRQPNPEVSQPSDTAVTDNVPAA